MATRPLRDFLPLVLPHAPTCPRPVAEQYLRLAAIEWCERTRCWRHIASTTLTNAQDEVIAAPDYATVHEIETAYFNGVELTPTQFSSADPADMDAAAGLGTPKYITQTAPNTVRVIPFAAGSLDLTLFLKPRSGTEYGTDPLDPLQDKYNVVPEHIFIQNAEAVAEGALARLLLLKDVAWFNPKLALFYRDRFDNACTGKFNSEIRGQQRASARSTAHFL